MNYRHAFHAGNFADVVKHIILTRILAYLMRKDAAFRVIDTHAGLGIYDLQGEQAERTGEWQDGIGKLIHVKRPAAVESLGVEAVVPRSGDGDDPQRRQPLEVVGAQSLHRAADQTDRVRRCGVVPEASRVGQHDVVRRQVGREVDRQLRVGADRQGVRPSLCGHG